MDAVHTTEVTMATVAWRGSACNAPRNESTMVAASCRYAPQRMPSPEASEVTSLLLEQLPYRARIAAKAAAPCSVSTTADHGMAVTAVDASPP